MQTNTGFTFWCEKCDWQYYFKELDSLYKPEQQELFKEET